MRVANVNFLSAGQSRFVLQFVLPAFAAVSIMATILIGVVLISGSSADEFATEKQRQLVATILQQRIEATAHEQEAVTIWDDAVRQVTSKTPDLQWIDLNLGTWMRSYYGHDEAFIVSASGEPIYGMRDGRRTDAAQYWQGPSRLAAGLTAKLKGAKRPHAMSRQRRALSAGEIGLGVVRSRPAIVSVKPIISDSGEVVQRQGEEFIHVAVRYLDASFIEELSKSYALDEARFAVHVPKGAESSVPLTTGAGPAVGYIAWKPFRPGTLLIGRLLPLSILAALMVCAVLTLLLRHIRRSTLALEASEAQAQHLAFHDPLTGLPNRAMFDDRLAHELTMARQSGTGLALLYLDLDGFKNVNDTLGHPAGDELIREVSARLHSAVRGNDLVARIGGDEFAIVQVGVSSPAEAEILCLRLLELISSPFLIARTKARVGVSVGIAFGPRDADDRAELARKADIALYSAKASGKGRFVFFSEGMDASIRRRNRIEADLRTAVSAGDQLELYYQPLYSPVTGQVTGAEALLRWHHPTDGLISPAMFVPVAEQTGQIIEVGEWVLEQACRDARDWPIGSVSVNVSAVQLRKPDFADRALAIIEKAGFPASRLEIEVTETSFIENAVACEANLSRLRGSGVKVALDDFGTGYSSFSHLRALSVDRLKIDRSFVSNIGLEGRGSPIISAIMDLAKASGLKVTAEGVETCEQRRFLAQIGCNTLQGFLMARPMPACEMDDIFHSAPVVA